MGSVMKDCDLVACVTLRNEIDKIIKEKNLNLPVHWMRNMHDDPDGMRKMLAEKIASLDSGPGTILLAYGRCGGGTSGISCRYKNLVIPKCGDCIDLLLAGTKDYERLRRDSFFVTRGWLDGEKNIRRQAKLARERLGEKRGGEYMKLLYGRYRHLAIVDTGTDDLISLKGKAEETAECAGISPDILCVSGSLKRLEKLLTGPWDDGFIVLPPGASADLEDFL